MLAVWATHHFPFQSEWQNRFMPGFHHALLHLTSLEKGQKRGLTELPVNALSSRRGNKEMCLDPLYPAKPGQGWAGLPVPAGCKEKLDEDGPIPPKGLSWQWGTRGPGCAYSTVSHIFSWYCRIYCCWVQRYLICWRGLQEYRFFPKMVVPSYNVICIQPSSSIYNKLSGDPIYLVYLANYF